MSRVHPEERLHKNLSQLTETTISSLPQIYKTVLQPRQFNEQACGICSNKKDKYFYFGACMHEFCKKCLQKYLKERMASKSKLTCCQIGCQEPIFMNSDNQQYLWNAISSKDRRKIIRYLAVSTISIPRCSQCVFDEEAQRVTSKCNKCREESVKIPENMRKCSKCQNIIEKLKGCDHLKCVCGHEFCFHCLQVWSHSHVCKSKIPQREGLSLIGCSVFKTLLLIPLLVAILALYLLFIGAICLISALLAGPILFMKLITEIQESSVGDGAKFIIFILGLLMLPVLMAIGLIVGPFVPFINLCYQKKLLLEVQILEDVASRLFGFVEVIKLI